MAKKLYLGVDLGGTSMRAGVIDKDGTLLGMEKRKTHPELGAAGVLERLVKTITNAAKAADVKLKNIGGIGIGVPGPIDAKKGIVRVAVNLGKDWTNYPLGPKLEAELGVPIYLDNDVRVGAIGEFKYGAGRNVKDMIAVFVGTGIGGGIVLDGKLRGGFRGGAGEVGHTIVAADNGIIGKTGHAGTVEPLAARTGMERMIRELVESGRQSVVPDLIEGLGEGRLTSSVIYEALKQKDEVMQETLAHSQYILGLLAANLVNILDPEMIVFGGGVTERLGDKFVAPIRQTAYANFINKTNAKAVKIVPAALKDASGVVGAAVLARENL
jgi:glucokinase